ncbi:GIN domain-containing protein [Algibacter mikhailovii]|uniref:Putative auto-transporter adhesin head GIN domain-containing protein n=1 Tax=Algibacter mikhailovii TaxID=425498 RepID=A0A918V4I1_9FLAO|nr:DUF2807 domain-containing protein [Algibacter mikhailovii]GGZ70196.1 hypothetical protein GCM10007028_04130 [Algibacter mikhailovii]
MKTNSPFLILTLLIFTIFSCHEDRIDVSPNDQITHRNISVEDYNSVEIENGFNAFITFSDSEESILVEGNTNLQHLIIAEIRDHILTVKLKNNVKVKGSPTLNVYIQSNSIENFKVTADSKITLENTLVSKSAYISMSADSYFTGELDIDDLKIKASADVRADLYGQVDFLDANLTADVKLSDYDLVINDLKLKMVADCDANLTVNKSIYLDANADCILTYKGDAQVVYQKLKADSKIRKVN